MITKQKRQHVRMAWAWNSAETFWPDVFFKCFSINSIQYSRNENQKKIWLSECGKCGSVSGSVYNFTHQCNCLLNWIEQPSVPGHLFGVNLWVWAFTESVNWIEMESASVRVIKVKKVWQSVRWQCWRFFRVSSKPSIKSITICEQSANNQSNQNTIDPKRTLRLENWTLEKCDFDFNQSINFENSCIRSV
jgi:hypothetical protein